MRSAHARFITAVLLLLATADHAAAADFLSMSGADLYLRFCAACHGRQAHGDGPVAAAMKIDVPDLTFIAQRRGGKFPRSLVEKIIDGRHTVIAHGSRQMPVWGEDFTRTEIGNPDAERGTRTVIERIAEFLSTIQK